MKVLITGGAGFIGRHLTSALLRQAADVTVFDNLHRHLEPSPSTDSDAGPAIRVADIRDQSAVASALEGVEVVCIRQTNPTLTPPAAATPAAPPTPEV